MKNHNLHHSIILIALAAFIFQACKHTGTPSGSSEPDSVQIESATDTEVLEADSEINPNEEVTLAQEDNHSIIIKFSLFSFIIPDGAEEGYTKDFSDDENMNEINLELFLMYETDAFSTNIRIESHQEDFRIIRIEQQSSTNLFFNEDGSGGTWTIEGVEPVFSEWMEIEQIDEDLYFSLSAEELEYSQPEISEESYMAAEENVSAAVIPTTYMEHPEENNFKIIWETDDKEGETIIRFVLLHGD